MRLWNRKETGQLCVWCCTARWFFAWSDGGVQAEEIQERISENEWKKLPTEAPGYWRGGLF